MRPNHGQGAKRPIIREFGHPFILERGETTNLPFCVYFGRHVFAI